MKKTVKSLIIAASVAAVAGIGAISFAKWEAGMNYSVDVKDQGTAQVTAIGEFTVSHDLSDTVKLMPYDQVKQVGSHKKMWTITVDDSQLNADDYTYVYKVAYLTATTESNDLGAGKLYVYTGSTKQTEAPTGAIASLTDWKALSSEQTVTIGNDKEIYIILVSDNTAEGEDQYNTDDMNKSFGVKISVAATDKAAE